MWFCYAAKIENHWVLLRGMGEGEKTVPLGDAEMGIKQQGRANIKKGEGSQSRDTERAG